MINETILSFSNSSAPIFVQSVGTTNWSQFILTIIMASFGIIIYIYFILQSLGFNIASIKATLKLRKPSLVLKHNADGLFSVSMIDQQAMNKVARFLYKNKDKEVNIILQTPGGTIFHSQAIAQMIQEHGRVSVIVPLMAMSGGTLLSLSANKIFMGKNAALGMIDPQLGNFWSPGSAADWKHVMKKKGVKANDNSVVFDREGSLYTSTIRKQIEGFLLINGSKSASLLAKRLTDGTKEHAYRFIFKDVCSWRNNVFLINPELEYFLVRLVV